MPSYPFTWRKTAEDEIAHWKAEAGQLRALAVKAEATAATEVRVRRRINDLYTALCDDMDRVTAQTAALSAQVTKLRSTGVDEVRAREMADTITRLRAGIAEARSEARAQKHRADLLQRPLDDAVGMPAGGVLSSASWQPGYTDPKADAS